MHYLWFVLIGLGAANLGGQLTQGTGVSIWHHALAAIPAALLAGWWMQGSDPTLFHFPAMALAAVAAMAMVLLIFFLKRL
ncbi:MAG: hypothetical protein AAFR61_05155 [Bacteroidota bacterium]